MSKLHPQIEQALSNIKQVLKKHGLDDLHSGGVESARAAHRDLRARGVVPPPIWSVEERTIFGPTGEVPLRVYRPSAAVGLPVLVWFHGGGWVLGDLDTADAICRTLAMQVGCIVVSVGYHLAPENPFPVPLDDCYAATAYVAETANGLGVDLLRIAVGGDSAGGNLAACVAQRARERGLPLAFQLLVYPVIRANFTCPSYEENADGYFLTRSAMQWFWDCYVPEAEDRENPEVAPIHAKGLSGLPPALIITAQFDPLRDEGEAYGAALAAAGVPVVVRRYEDVVHGFFGMATEGPVPSINAALTDAVHSLRTAFGMPLGV